MQPISIVDLDLALYIISDRLYRVSHSKLQEIYEEFLAHCVGEKNLFVSQVESLLIGYVWSRVIGTKLN